MSQENVTVVRRGWDAYAESGVDAFFDESFAADSVCEDFPELPDRGVYAGREGFRERYWHFVDTWGDFAIGPVEFTDAPDDVVIAEVAMSGRGQGSGAPLDARAFFVYDLRDGAVVRDRVFTSRSQALDAAGLRD